MVGSHFQLSPGMFDWVHARALAGPLKDILKDIHRVVPKALLCCLVCVFRVIVLLECEPLLQSEVLSALDQVFFIMDISVLCSVQHSLIPDQFPSPCRWKTSPQHDTATTMLHRWDGIGQVMSGAWFLPDMTLEAKQFNIGFIWQGCFSVWESFVLFYKLQAGFHVSFTEKRPLCYKAQIGEVLKLWLSFWRFLPYPHRIAGAMPEWQSGSLSPLLPRLFSPDCSVFSSTQSCLWALQSVPSTSWQIFLWYALSSIKGGLQERCWKISKMIKRNGRHLR